jgi:hypothetical protein
MRRGMVPTQGVPGPFPVPVPVGFPPRGALRAFGPHLLPDVQLPEGLAQGPDSLPEGIDLRVILVLAQELLTCYFHSVDPTWIKVETDLGCAYAYQSMVFGPLHRTRYRGIFRIAMPDPRL